MTRGHSDLRVDDFQVIIDSREEHPFELVVQVDGEPQQMRTVVAGLPTGDYSISGAEHLIAVERKSFEDLIGSLGAGRERFDREMQRILAYPSRCVIVEGHISQLELGQWRGNLKPASAIGSVLGFMDRGIPFIFAGDRRAAAIYCARFLYVAARRRFRELRAFQSSLKLVSGEP